MNLKVSWTKRLVMITILAEVSGKSEKYVSSVLAICLPKSPQTDDEIPESEALETLTKLRQEKAGIFNWLLKGRMDALADIHSIASRN